jgi:hypothetical protein
MSSMSANKLEVAMIILLVVDLKISYGNSLGTTLSPTSPPSRGRGFASLPLDGGGTEGEGDARYQETAHLELPYAQSNLKRQHQRALPSIFYLKKAVDISVLTQFPRRYFSAFHHP